MEDLNANDVDAAMKIIEGTVRSMEVTVEPDRKPKSPSTSDVERLFFGASFILLF